MQSGRLSGGGGWIGGELGFSVKRSAVRIGIVGRELISDWSGLVKNGNRGSDIGRARVRRGKTREKCCQR